MKIMSRIYDHRINSVNLYVETTFGEYLSFADKIIKNNELQRKRVKTSKSVYALLKDDLKKRVRYASAGFGGNAKKRDRCR